MKLPETPPDYHQLLNQIISSGSKRLLDIMQSHNKPLDSKGNYSHWDKIKYLTPPLGLTEQEYWFALKSSRMAQYKQLPFIDKHRHHFQIMITDPMLEAILWIEKNSTGSMLMEGENISDQLGKSYIYNSSIEEAISSSQLEGASTTRRVAKDMIKAGRHPVTKHERMIFNNFTAMNYIKEIADYELTPALILKLHSILTEGTFGSEDDGAEGRLRTKADDICVHASDTTIVHVPPSADELEERLQMLCDFANEEHSTVYLPTIIKAIVLHFMIGYDHPFVDGNGRTARALFYWYLAKHNYWLMEHASISRVLKQAPVQYMRAYLYTENDDNDLSYFADHQIQVIKKAIEDVQAYLKEQNRKINNVKTMLNKQGIGEKLNLRQIKLLESVINKPGYELDVHQHQQEFSISNQTARTDLLKLADEYGLLRKRKVGKKDVFHVPDDISRRLQLHDLE